MRSVLAILQDVTGINLLGKFSNSRCWQKKIEMKKVALNSYKKVNKIMKAERFSLSEIEQKIQKIIPNTQSSFKSSPLINYY